MDGEGEQVSQADTAIETPLHGGGEANSGEAGGNASSTTTASDVAITVESTPAGSRKVSSEMEKRVTDYYREHNPEKLEEVRCVSTKLPHVARGLMYTPLIWRSCCNEQVDDILKPFAGREWLIFPSLVGSYARSLAFGVEGPLSHSCLCH